jgi:hypothetical protein
MAAGVREGCQSPGSHVAAFMAERARGGCLGVLLRFVLSTSQLGVRPDFCFEGIANRELASTGAGQTVVWRSGRLRPSSSKARAIRPRRHRRQPPLTCSQSLAKQLRRLGPGWRPLLGESGSNRLTSAWATKQKPRLVLVTPAPSIGFGRRRKLWAPTSPLRAKRPSVRTGWTPTGRPALLRFVRTSSAVEFDADSCFDGSRRLLRSARPLVSKRGGRCCSPWPSSGLVAGGSPTAAVVQEHQRRPGRRTLPHRLAIQQPARGSQRLLRFRSLRQSVSGRTALLQVVRSRTLADSADYARIHYSMLGIDVGRAGRRHTRPVTPRSGNSRARSAYRAGSSAGCRARPG